MPRFAILFHEMPPQDERENHFDLMFERGKTLLTWAVDTWPLRPKVPINARQLSPHRLEYLDYEGEVSGKRGTVTRVEYGHYELLESRQNKLMVIDLCDCDSRGEYRLSRDGSDDEPTWTIERKY